MLKRDMDFTLQYPENHTLYDSIYVSTKGEPKAS